MRSERNTVFHVSLVKLVHKLALIRLSDCVHMKLFVLACVSYAYMLCVSDV